MPAGMREFAADARYKAATVVVTMDPADPGRGSAPEEFDHGPQPRRSATLLLCAPGQILGKFPTGGDTRH